MSASKLLGIYRLSLKEHPLRTPMITAGLIAISGDFVSQVFVERKPLADYNYWETIRFASVACFWVAPLLSPWYRFLDRVVTGPPRRAIVKRVIVDQCLFSPVFLSSILVLVRGLDGDTPKKIIKHWKDEFPAFYASSLKVVPFAQLLNFWLVPLKYRILAVQGIALLFHLYMTYKDQYICGSEETKLLNRSRGRGKTNVLRERPDSADKIKVVRWSD